MKKHSLVGGKKGRSRPGRGRGQRWRGACALVAFLGIAACSDSSGDAPGGQTGACNDGQDHAPEVTPVAVAEDAPAPQGGAFHDGTYTLTSVRLYTGPGGSTGPLSGAVSAVFQIQADTMQQVGTAPGEAAKTYTSTLSTSGTIVTVRDTCPPDPATKAHEYTASDTAFAIYDDVAGGVLEQLYTLR